ncbi:hypothetical protein GR212_15560 [Rhizobium lusitanum]|uniref:Uncharacterized protein n=1 Tax=Rhizobium lusitanum TaxID=293958 RepID=A0A6L9U4X0_9HYPH|nr:hypothetical protein [Rhizobium lusitanum]NEI70995.1 hypothetical protein [Rhizobium lusitanum]
MLKLTRTKSGMSIITVKAFGFYANVSYGKGAKAKRNAVAGGHGLPLDWFGMAACAVLLVPVILTMH